MIQHVFLLWSFCVHIFLKLRLKPTQLARITAIHFVAVTLRNPLGAEWKQTCLAKTPESIAEKERVHTSSRVPAHSARSITHSLTWHRGRKFSGDLLFATPSNSKGFHRLRDQNFGPEKAQMQCIIRLSRSSLSRVWTFSSVYDGDSSSQRTTQIGLVSTYLWTCITRQSCLELNYGASLSGELTSTAFQEDPVSQLTSSIRTPENPIFLTPVYASSLRSSWCIALKYSAQTLAQGLNLAQRWVHITGITWRGGSVSVLRRDILFHQNSHVRSAQPGAENKSASPTPQQIHIPFFCGVGVRLGQKQRRQWQTRRLISLCGRKTKHAGERTFGSSLAWDLHTSIITSDTHTNLSSLPRRGICFTTRLLH